MLSRRKTIPSSVAPLTSSSPQQQQQRSTSVPTMAQIESTQRRRQLIERLNRSLAANEQQMAAVLSSGAGESGGRSRAAMTTMVGVHPGAIAENLQRERRGSTSPIRERNVHGGPVAGARHRDALRRANNNSNADNSPSSSPALFDVNRLRAAGIEEVQYRAGLRRFAAVSPEREIAKATEGVHRIWAAERSAQRDRMTYTLEGAELRELAYRAITQAEREAASHAEARALKQRRAQEVRDGQQLMLTAAALAHAASLSTAEQQEQRQQEAGQSPQRDVAGSFSANSPSSLQRQQQNRTAPRESDAVADMAGGLSSSRRRHLREYVKNNNSSSSTANNGVLDVARALAQDDERSGVMNQLTSMEQQRASVQDAKRETEHDDDDRQLRDAFHLARDGRWPMEVDAVRSGRSGGGGGGVRLADKNAPVVPVLASWFEQTQHHYVVDHQQQQRQQRRLPETDGMITALSPSSQVHQHVHESNGRTRSLSPNQQSRQSPYHISTTRMRRRSPLRGHSQQPLDAAVVQEVEARIQATVAEKLSREQRWKTARDPFSAMRPAQPAHTPMRAPGTNKILLEQRKKQDGGANETSSEGNSNTNNQVKYGFSWQRYSWKGFDVEAAEREHREYEEAMMYGVRSRGAGPNDYIQAHAKVSAALRQHVSKIRSATERSDDHAASPESQKREVQQQRQHQRLRNLYNNKSPQEQQQQKRGANASAHTPAVQVRPIRGAVKSSTPQPKASSSSSRTQQRQQQHRQRSSSSPREVSSGAAAAVESPTAATAQQQAPAARSKQQEQQQQQQQQQQRPRRGSIQEVNDGSDSRAASNPMRPSSGATSSSAALDRTCNSVSAPSVVTEARRHDSSLSASGLEARRTTEEQQQQHQHRAQSAPRADSPSVATTVAVAVPEPQQLQQQPPTPAAASPPPAAAPPLAVVSLDDNRPRNPQLVSMLRAAQRPPSGAKSAGSPLVQQQQQPSAAPASRRSPSPPSLLDEPVTSSSPPQQQQQQQQPSYHLSAAKLRDLDDSVEDISIFKRGLDDKSSNGGGATAVQRELHESRPAPIMNVDASPSPQQRKTTIVREYDMLDSQPAAVATTRNSEESQQQSQREEFLLTNSLAGASQQQQQHHQRPASSTSTRSHDVPEAKKLGASLTTTTSTGSSSGRSAGQDCDIPIADWNTPARSSAASSSSHGGSGVDASTALARALREQRGGAGSRLSSTAASSTAGRLSSAGGSTVVDETEEPLPPSSAAQGSTVISRSRPLGAAQRKPENEKLNL